MNDGRDDRAEFERMREDYPETENLERGPEHRFDTFLGLVSFGVFFSVLFGMNTVLDGEGVARNALVLFVASIAGAFSYNANKAAFHIGSKLAAAGNRRAIALVVGWFALMATVVGTIGFAGVSREIVEGANLREPMAAMSDASRRVGEGVGEARRVVPLITSIAGDLAGIAACEAGAGCVSGRAGRGPQVAALEALADKLRGIERQYQQADGRRAQLTERLEALTSRYEEQLSAGGVTGKSRARLIAIYAEAQSLVTELAGVVPTAVAAGLVGELRQLDVAPARRGRIDVGARLKGHADRLEEALAGIARGSIALPPFPSPAGIAVGWERLDLTWPLALLLFGMEVILVVLWLLMVLDFEARRRALQNAAKRRDDDGDDAGPSNPLPARRGEYRPEARPGNLGTNARRPNGGGE